MLRLKGLIAHSSLYIHLYLHHMLLPLRWRASAFTNHGHNADSCGRGLLRAALLTQFLRHFTKNNYVQGSFTLINKHISPSLYSIHAGNLFDPILRKNISIVQQSFPATKTKRPITNSSQYFPSQYRNALLTSIFHWF